MTTRPSAAYRRGVFVARPVPNWTIAHSRIHLTPVTDATDPRFPTWLQTLSRQLGDVQYFATARIGEYHAWAKVESGELTRAYCYIGERGEVPLHLGEPTDIEKELGVGQRWLEDGWQDWQEPDWDDWFAAMPREDHVMRIAERWGICPLDIAGDSVNPQGSTASRQASTLATAPRLDRLHHLAGRHHHASVRGVRSRSCRHRPLSAGRGSLARHRERTRYGREAGFVDL